MPQKIRTRSTIHGSSQVSSRDYLTHRSIFRRRVSTRPTPHKSRPFQHDLTNSGSILARTKSTLSRRVCQAYQKEQQEASRLLHSLSGAAASGLFFNI